VKHPSDYYIRYLLAASWGDPEQPLTLEAVNQTLDDMGLKLVQDKQWDYLLSTFQAPPDFLFNNARHQPTIDFMKAEKIYTIWVSSEDMRRVLTEIVGDHSNRLCQHDMHILIMGNVPADIIAAKLSKKYFLTRSLTSGMVELYRHYFWRTDNLSKPEWCKFLKDDPNYHDYIAPLQCGEQQALFRAGLNPRYDYKQSIRDMHRQGSFRMQYLAFQPDDKMTVDLYVKVAREVRSSYSILYGEGGGYEEKLQEVRHWIMEHRDQVIPAIHDLVGLEGSYSGDGKAETKQLTEVEQPKQLEEGKGDQDGRNEDA
jgi:hypothetical protein